MAKTTMKDLAEILEQVQAQLAALSERVEQLEAAGSKPPAVEEAPHRRHCAGTGTARPNRRNRKLRKRN